MSREKIIGVVEMAFHDGVNGEKAPSEDVFQQVDYIVKSIAKAHLLLADLVSALNETNWSSWQSTAKFQPALSAAERFLTDEQT